MKFDVEGWGLDNVDGAHITGSNQISGTCPWCGKKDHFYISIESGNYICFACDEKGRRLLGVLAHIEGVSLGEAQRFLMRNQIEFRRKETAETLLDKIASFRGDGDEESEVDCPLPSEFIPVFKDGRWQFPMYLKERKIKRETAKAWNLGWCRTGRYAYRVVIPVVCSNGRAFTARGTTGDMDPKYLNPTDVDFGKLLCGWELAPLRSDLVLVEGPLDAIKMWQHGIPAVSLLGKVLHDEQMAMLFEKPKDSVITVMLDPEELEAPYKVASSLLCRFENVFIAKLPSGVDPGASTKKQALAAVNGATKFKGERVGKMMALIGNSRAALGKLH